MELHELEEDWPEELTPLTEREPETELQQQWADNGFVVLEDFVDEELLRSYEREWWSANGNPDLQLEAPDIHGWASPGGWPYATPYMDHPALRDLVCDGKLASVLEELTGEPMGVHLNLTGWVSTRRDWHRDQYLNDPYVGDFYTAVWVALDTVETDAGPFEFIPGTHKGRPISQLKMRAALGSDGDGPDWPTHSERILTPLFEEGDVKVAKRGGRVRQFLAERGDVLVWHGRLLHRGSTPTNPIAPRRSLIAHYSGIHHRPDMTAAVQHQNGGWYFPLRGLQPTNYKMEAVNA